MRIVETLPRVDAGAALGTRFLVYPQPPFVPGYERPEVVWIAAPPDRIGPGPSSRRMYVVDPVLDKAPYHFPDLPPFVGLFHPPAQAGPDGHFDHLDPESREFLAAHAFACVHRVVDIAENYLGRPLDWFFAPTYERLEIVPRLTWDNAQSGYGFLELGEDDSRGAPFPFALNFDAIAHECGHLVLFGALGLPLREEPNNDFLAYHETVADFTALLGLLHFDTALDRILRRTRGNLLLENELDRLAELSDEKAVRVASHALKLADVGMQVHDRSRPLTGALFDALVDIFQSIQIARGVPGVDPREVEEARRQLSEDEIEQELAVPLEDYERRHFTTKAALADARDILGETLMRSWSLMEPDGFSFAEAAEMLLVAAERGQGRRYVDRIESCLAWRGFFG